MYQPEFWDGTYAKPRHKKPNLWERFLNWLFIKTNGFS